MTAAEEDLKVKGLEIPGDQEEQVRTEEEEQGAIRATEDPGEMMTEERKTSRVKEKKEVLTVQVRANPGDQKERVLMGVEEQVAIRAIEDPGEMITEEMMNFVVKEKTEVSTERIGAIQGNHPEENTGNVMIHSKEEATEIGIMIKRVPVKEISEIQGNLAVPGHQEDSETNRLENLLVNLPVKGPIRIKVSQEGKIPATNIL